jgi:uncharacterized protein YjbJ (UPF0337 family)
MIILEFAVGNVPDDQLLEIEGSFEDAPDQV